MINSNIATVRKSMSNLAHVEVESQVSKLQNIVFELEIKLCDLNETTYAHQIGVIKSRMIHIENKINSMEERMNKKQKS